MGMDVPIHVCTHKIPAHACICAYVTDNLQVLEIEVYPTKSQGRLYDFKGHIYMRRDGSLQGPLKGREVQEWIRTVRNINHNMSKCCQ